MKKRQAKNVLFLCTGNYYRSRFAEIFFNSMAEKMGLAWRATSRGLALERGINNVGPMALAAVAALEARGIRITTDLVRFPVQALLADLDAADWVVALKESEHLPLLRERYPACADKVEFWDVDDTLEALALIELEVMDLAARLIAGGKRREAQTIVAEPPTLSRKNPANTNATVVRLGRETKGRRGKGVTTVSDLPLNESALQELATTLKQRCGTGGTVKDGLIEIQGDQRDRLAKVLEGMGYRVKRVGG